jgi:hypothetical protein
MRLYIFRTVPLSIIRSLFTVHSAMVYVIQVCRQLSSRIRMDLQFHPNPARKMSETCRVSCQNKFVKLVHLVGFIINKFVTMHGHVDVKSVSVFSNWMIVFLWPRCWYSTVWNVRNAYRILVKNFEEKRPLGRTRCRWEDSKMHSYFKELHVRMWAPIAPPTATDPKLFSLNVSESSVTIPALPPLPICTTF